MDGEAVKYAKSHGSYSEIFCSDIETLPSNLDELTGCGFNEFDVIVCADILEHIKNINEITLSLIQLLSESGSLIISVPNIGHIDIVFNLINNNFNYSPFGILDNSHLRFFTKNSFVQWITLLGKDNGLEFEIDLIGQTHIEEIYQPESGENDSRQLKRKRLLDLYNEIGGSNECFVYQNVFKIKPLRAHILCREGERFFKQGNIEKAITLFKRAISIDPKCAMTHNNLATAYHSKGELGKTIEHLTTALSLEPENRDVVWNCGQIFLEIGQLDSALEIYQTFLKKYPDDFDFKEVVGALTRY
jgi:tetratricopeptide (TPR) repeat protein